MKRIKIRTMPMKMRKDATRSFFLMPFLFYFFFIWYLSVIKAADYLKCQVYKTFLKLQLFEIDLIIKFYILQMAYFKGFKILYNFHIILLMYFYNKINLNG